jgi:hypothetical protein
MRKIDWMLVTLFLAAAAALALAFAAMHGVV